MTFDDVLLAYTAGLDAEIAILRLVDALALEQRSAWARDELLERQRLDLAQDGDLGVEAVDVGEQEVVERHQVPAQAAGVATCDHASRSGASSWMTSRIGALERWMLASTRRSFMCT